MNGPLLKTWLEEKGFGEYYLAFIKEGAQHLSDLAILTESDLKELAADWNLGKVKRRKLVDAVHELRVQRSRSARDIREATAPDPPIYSDVYPDSQEQPGIPNDIDASPLAVEGEGGGV